MLQLKATNFGIKLSLVKEDSPTLKPKQPKSKKEEKMSHWIRLTLCTMASLDLK